MSTTASISMHPLLFQPQEYPVKWLVTLTYAAFLHSCPLFTPKSLHEAEGCGGAAQSASKPARMPVRPAGGPTSLSSHDRHREPKPVDVQSVVVWAYLAGFLALELFCSAVHPAVWGPRLPFLPLMLTSVYCSIGMLAVWLRMFLKFIYLLRASC